MTEKVVGFHFGPRADVAKHDKQLGRSHGGIIKGIHNLGLDVAITRGAQHFDFKNGIVDQHWRVYDAGRDIITASITDPLVINQFGVVRDYGKLLRPTEIHPLALLNDPKVMVYDLKFPAYQDALAQWQVPTVLASLDNLDQLDQLQGKKLVFKPNKGFGGVGVEIVDREEASDVLTKHLDTEMIAQEYVDMTAPFPPEIVGITEEDQDKIKTLAGRKKEIRQFVFRGAQAFETLPIARFMKEDDETNDTWVYIDPEKIPAELRSIAAAALDNIARKTNVDEIYGAIDFTWGSTHALPELQWRVGEINLWKPVMYRKGNAAMSALHDQHTAQQLARIARERA